MHALRGSMLVSKYRCCSKHGESQVDCKSSVKDRIPPANPLPVFSEISVACGINQQAIGVMCFLCLLHLVNLYTIFLD